MTHLTPEGGHGLTQFEPAGAAIVFDQAAGPEHLLMATTVAADGNRQVSHGRLVGRVYRSPVAWKSHENDLRTEPTKESSR